MATFDVYNGVLAALKLSFKALTDTGYAQRVEAIPADDIPVALTAANARHTVSSTTISLSSKLVGTEEYCYLEASIADILWWDDGKDPATTPGHILSAGYAMRISKSQIANFKYVRATGVDAVALLSGYRNV